MMKFLSKLNRMDRRIVFLLVTVVILIPLLLNIQSRLYVDKATHDLFNRIDAIQPGGQPILISFDYDPQVAPELDPMAVAVLRHCFAKGIKVIGMGLQPQGDAIGEAIISRISKEYNKKSGTDYCYFGYRPGGYIVMLYIGENVKKALPQDYYGVSYDSLPMMKGIHNYDDIPLVLSLAGSTWPNTWIMFAGTRYKASIADGCTAVMAPEYYPFLQTGQLVGQMAGMKGAAEYEQLIVDAGYTKSKDIASKAMSAISYSHILIILLIVMGNIGYFVTRRMENK